MSITDISPIIWPPSFGNYGANSTLDATDEFVGVVIRIPKSGTLSKIGWKSGSTISGSSYTLKISLETVSETIGQPVATSNAAKTLYSAGAESADITSISALTVYYTAINGASGISVTQGDLVAITFRLTAVSGSSITVRPHTDNAYKLGLALALANSVYSFSYLGSAWAVNRECPLIALEYSDGLCATPFAMPPCEAFGLSYKSDSALPYQGIKFKYPVKCRLSGIIIIADIDCDSDIYLYDSDEYTAITGFPYQIKTEQRAYDSATSAFLVEVVFPTKATIESDTWYRLIVVPTTTTPISVRNNRYTNDGSYLGIMATHEGANCVLTTRGSAPSSGDHTWTDSTTDKPTIFLIIDGIDVSAGGTGGISRSRQLMG